MCHNHLHLQTEAASVHVVERAAVFQVNAFSPHLSFASWRTTGKVNIDNLPVLQQKVVRSVENESPGTHGAPLFHKQSLLTTENSRNKKTALFIY